MKIIKKSQDFYDSVLGYGVDESIVYKRETSTVDIYKHSWTSESLFSAYSDSRPNEEYRKLPECIKALLTKLNETSLDSRMSIKIKDKEVSVSYSYILFCGDVIPVLKISGSWKIHPRATEEQLYTYSNFEEFAYSMADFVKILGLFFDKEFIEDYLSSNKRWSDTKRRHAYQAFFNAGYGLSVENIHHEIDCPVIQIKSKGYVLNPVLKELKFAKKHDPFTTYQKLEQFISGVLGGMSPKMVEIADIDRLVGHGFDKKVSFRKRKEQ